MLGNLTSEDAAKILGLSRAHLIEIATRGVLQGARTPGGHWRFSEAVVLEYKRAKMAQSNGLSTMINSSVELGMYACKAAQSEKREDN